MNRRSFLRSLLAGPVAAAVPWQSLVTAPLQVHPSIAELNAIVCRIWGPVIEADFYEESPFLKLLRSRDPITFERGRSIQSPVRYR